MKNEHFFNYAFPGDEKFSKLPSSAYDDPSNNRTRSAYCGIIYNENIIDSVLDSFEDCVISPMHYADDEHVKMHWHVYVNFGRNGQRYQSVLNKFHDLGIVGCMHVENKTSMLRYYAHRTSSSRSKQQFSDEQIKMDLRCSDPEKLPSYIKLITGVDPVISDYDNIYKIVTSEHHHFTHYVDLLEYLRNMDAALYLFACRNSSFCIKILRSQEYKIKKLNEFGKEY